MGGHFLFEKYDHVLEPAGIVVTDVGESLVSFQNMLRLIFVCFSPFLPAFGELLDGFLALFRPTGAFAIHIEKMVESEAFEKLFIALVGIEDTEAAFIGFPQTEGGSREGPEKGGVHHGAALEVEHKVAMAIGHRGLEDLLELEAVLEGATTLDTNPKDLTDLTDEDG